MGVHVQGPVGLTDAPQVGLSGEARKVAREQPELWRALQELGEKAGRAGPLDARTRRAVHLAMAIAAGSEGATHSHARRALSEGFTPDEIEHVAWLGVTTLGWPQAIKGLTWIRDETRKERRRDGHAA
jgi:alkylhydroperoxidase/carboxymuconolactone decarboxylase family protein YurZ